MLGQYDVHPNPTTLRFGERVGRGFTREAFSDAWARYTVTTDTTVTTQAPSGADVTAVTLVTVDDEESDDGARVSVSDVTELAASLGAEHDRARNRAGDGLEDAGGW
jgi:IS4 transposase